MIIHKSKNCCVYQFEKNILPAAKKSAHEAKSTATKRGILLCHKTE